MSPILEKTQEGLPQFVTSHLSVTFLILEGASFNVNQAIKGRLVMSSERSEESRSPLLPIGVTY